MKIELTLCGFGIRNSGLIVGFPDRILTFEGEGKAVDYNYGTLFKMGYRFGHFLPSGQRGYSSD